MIFRNSEGETWRAPLLGSGEAELVVDVRPQKEMVGLATGGGKSKIDESFLIIISLMRCSFVIYLYYLLL